MEAQKITISLNRKPTVIIGTDLFVNSAGMVDAKRHEIFSLDTQAKFWAWVEGVEYAKVKLATGDVARQTKKFESMGFEVQVDIIGEEKHHTAFLIINK